MENNKKNIKILIVSTIVTLIGIGITAIILIERTDFEEEAREVIVSKELVEYVDREHKIMEESLEVEKNEEGEIISVLDRDTVSKLKVGEVSISLEEEVDKYEEERKSLRAHILVVKVLELIIKVLLILLMVEVGVLVLKYIKE